jgi:hypothetical protein
MTVARQSCFPATNTLMIAARMIPRARWALTSTSISLDRVDAFISLCLDECGKRLGDGVERQKSVDERSISYGAGRSIVLISPLRNPSPVALVSTTTQREGQGLVAKTSFLSEGTYELFTRLSDARIHRAIMPILGAGHGRIAPALAFVSLLLAVAEAARHAPGGRPLTRITIVVFQKTPDSPPQLDPVVVRCGLALISSTA